MQKHFRVLLVEDSSQDADLIREMLIDVDGHTFDVERVARLSKGLQRLDEASFDLVLLDLLLPDSRGVETFTTLNTHAPHLPIIVLTGFDDEALAVQAVRAGAQDYLVKGEVNSVLLDRALRYAVERKRAEEALRESEERFRMTIQHSPIGVGIVDSEGNLTDCNAALATMVGYSREELLRLNFADFTHPDDLAREWQLIEALWNEETTEYRMEKRYIHRNGHTIWVDVAASLFKDETDELAFGFAFVQDITKRKESKEALQRYANQQAALYAITAAASSSLVPDEMLASVLGEALTVMGSDVGWVIMLDPTGDAQHRVVASHGIPEAIIKQETSGILRDYLSDIANMTVDEVQHRMELLATSHPLSPETRTQLELYHGRYVPLTAYGQVLGFLHLARRDPDAPLAVERPLLTTMGQQIGLALRNAQLYQEARKVDRLQTVNEITAAVVSSLEMDQVLHRILEMTSHALNATEGSVLLNKPGGRGLTFAMTLEEETHNLRDTQIEPGQGIASWVVSHDQAVYVNNVERDPRFYREIDARTGFQTHSVICAPMKHRGENLGVIEFVNKRTGKFDDGDLSLLEAVTSIAAVALKNASLYTVTRSHADKIVTLFKIGQTLTSTLDYASVVRKVLQRIQELFSSDSVWLLQADPQSHALHFVEARTLSTHIDTPMQLSKDEGIIGWTIAHHEPIVVRDAHEDARFSNWIEQHLGIEIRALMVVPLTTKEQIVGVIAVSTCEPGTYDRQDLNMLQAVAPTLSTAIENARLYEGLKQLLREREETQAQMIHTEKMAALGRLMASIAHEVNNPLQAVQGYVSLSQEKLENSEHADALKRYLSIVSEEVERISDILSRMGEFYRPGRADLRSVDVDTVIEKVLALAGKKLEHSHVTVEHTAAENLPRIEANADQLKQVFLNLVINAIDAMPEGGTLYIRTALEREQTVGESIPLARIEFTDTGMGMSQDVIDRLFEPFFTTKKEGTGLGIFISYNIIQAHHGELAVQSKKGKGTTFTVRLPVEQPDM